MYVCEIADRPPYEYHPENSVCFEDTYGDEEMFTPGKLPLMNMYNGVFEKILSVANMIQGKIGPWTP